MPADPSEELVSRLESNWQYAEQYPTETEAQVRARRLSLELGIEPVSRAVAAALSALVASSGARAILEIGTGVGVSGLAVLRYAPRRISPPSRSNPSTSATHVRSSPRRRSRTPGFG